MNAILHPQVNTSKTVLIVEDSLSERTLLKSKLSKLDYEVVTADNGSEALKVLTSYYKRGVNIPMVISDWHMPKMDGLQLCEVVKSKISQSPYFIILTGRTEPDDLVEAFAAGADDYIGKPLNIAELKARVEAGLRMNRLNAEVQQKNKALTNALAKQKEQNQEILLGLEAAAKLQKSTLPDQKEVHKGIAMAHYFNPAQGVAGDTYSMFDLGEKCAGFYQVDVAGHGVRSAMLSYAISRHVNDLVQRYNLNESDIDMLNPAEVVEHLNHEFACDESCSDYFTIVYGVIDPSSESASLCQAGHPHPYLLEKNKTLNRLGGGGTPVGLFENSHYDQEKFQFKPGDKLVIFTDGVWECYLDESKKITEPVFRQILESLSSVGITKLQCHLKKIFDKIVAVEAPADDLSFFVLGYEDG